MKVIIDKQFLECMIEEIMRENHSMWNGYRFTSEDALEKMIKARLEEIEKESISFRPYQEYFERHTST